MRIAHVIAVVFSLLLLGAHFLRAGVPIPVLTIALAILLAMLFVRRPWAARLLQLVLVLGAIEWARVAIVLASHRAELGEPYGRLLLILGVVVAVALVTAMAFRHPSIARTYGAQRRNEPARQSGG